MWTKRVLGPHLIKICILKQNQRCSKWSSIYLSILACEYTGNTNDSNITKQMAATNLPLFANSHFTQSVIKSQWTRGSPYIPITKAGGAVISPFSVFYENILSRSRRRGGGRPRSTDRADKTRTLPKTMSAEPQTVTNAWTCVLTVYPIRKNNTGKGEATC